MALATLLGDLTPRTFLENYFLRLPLAMPGNASAYRELGGWEALDSILRHADADVLVVRDGARADKRRPLSAQNAQSLVAEGYTVLARHAERQHAGLADLAVEFGQEFDAPVDVHLYVTGSGHHGFGWHYDAEDVFVLQTVGTKDYWLRKNTVNPWPTFETLPADMRYEREIMPVVQCRLDAGDWLYIPNGYWHRAAAQTDSLSLAVGVMPPTGLDVLAAVREQALASLLWRQRLPITGDAAGLSDAETLREYGDRLHRLAEDLTALLSSECFARGLLERRRAAQCR
jgi:ribosomal protein L16 Arg81 hydroxylase